MRDLVLVFSFLCFFQEVHADGNDWVDPSYVLQAAASNSAETASAQSKIISYAGSSAKNGPWTVSIGTSVKPPNGDPRDYLSWAPYHWPNCNWCSGPRTRLSTGAGGNRTDSDGSSTEEGPEDTSGCDNDGSCSAVDSWNADDNNYDDGDDDESPDNTSTSTSSGDDEDPDDDTPIPSVETSTLSLQLPTSRMVKRVSRSWTSGWTMSMPGVEHIERQGERDVSSISLPIVTTSSLVILPLSQSQSSSTDGSEYMTDSPDAAQDAGKTAKPKPKTTSTRKASATNAPPRSSSNSRATATAKSSCTPSPTKSLAPSATWTTCPYVVRDGKLNPDVRMLNGVNAIADVTQSVLYNALAAVLVTNSASAKTYAKNAASFIQTFFLDSRVGAYPEINYGQVIRGPGLQQGQYLGILDWRGMVKVANAIQLMKAAKIPDWTGTLDAQMAAWTQQYVKWLTTSDLGKTAGSAPNNHGSYYANQMAAMSVLLGDNNGAKAALQNYFQGQFLDQIAASGEQPFEAVRTRPYHYRCFNLEAMITNAKLGDYLGLNLWIAKSKYGATIQTALDYTMNLNPGKEDVTDIFPHVEAVAAAYGDPQGKYVAFLKKNFPDYSSATYYFYDQPEALKNSPAAGKGKKETVDTLDTYQQLLKASRVASDTIDGTSLKMEAATTVGDVDGHVPLPTPTIPFKCPDAFNSATEVELDDGVYVTCDELEPYYGYVEGAINNP